MSKIIVNSKVYSKNSNETLNGIKAIYKYDVISYVNDNIKVSINILSDKIELIREDENMVLNLNFENNKTITSKYYIKDLNLNIKVDVKTTKLVINNNKFVVEYDLYMNEEFSDSFTYELEWRDL